MQEAICEGFGKEGGGASRRAGGDGAAIASANGVSTEQASPRSVAKPASPRVRCMVNSSRRARLPKKRPARRSPTGPRVGANFARPCPIALSAYLDAYLCESHVRMRGRAACWRRVSRTCRDRTQRSARLLPKASGTWSRSSRTPFLKEPRKRWRAGARSPWSRRWSEASPWRAPWRKPIRSCPGRSSRPPGKNSAVSRSAIIEAPHRRAVRGAENGPLRHDDSGRPRPACQSAD